MIVIFFFSNLGSDEIEAHILSNKRHFFEKETEILQNLFISDSREFVRNIVKDWSEYNETEFNMLTKNYFSFCKTSMEIKIKYFLFTNIIVTKFDKISKRRLNVCIKTIPSMVTPPSGFQLIKNFVEKKELVIKEIEEVFKKYPKLQTSTGIDHVVINGRTGFMNGTNYYKQYEDTIELLKDYPNLYEICKKGLNYCSGKNKFASFSISKLKNSTGLHAHIDHITEKRGNIVVINLGADIFYDMFPLLTFSSDLSLRIPIKNGDMAILDKSARYEWTHSIPDFIYDSYNRYAILFKSIMPTDMLLMPYKNEGKKSKFYTD